MSDRQLATTPPKALVDQLRQYDPRKALVIAREEDLLALSPLVRIDVTAVTLGECANVGGGKVMPSRDATDRIAHAAGITFDEAGCSVEKIDRCVWVGRATATRMERDGSTARAVAEYEWDAELRAEEIADKPAVEWKNRQRIERPKTDADRRADLIQMRKFGRQRADTGARLRVIRMLAGIPTAFKSADAAKPLVLHRCSRDTDAMMADPALREMLVKQMLGATTDVFGPSPMRNVTPEPEGLPEPEPIEGDEAPAEPAAELQGDGGVRQGLIDRLEAAFAKVGAAPDYAKAQIDRAMAWDIGKLTEYVEKAERAVAGMEAEPSDVETGGEFDDSAEQAELEGMAQ